MAGVGKTESVKVQHHPSLQPEDWARFVELRPFERQWKKLKLTDEDRKALQVLIMAQPDSPVIPGTGGLRKIRFSSPQWSRGKRSGARVCYVYFRKFAVVFLVTIYVKKDKEDLSSEEKKRIKELIRELEEALEKGIVHV